jgi:4-diphosphocytidyl-2-C-methyl-D-erythritol kinase
VTAAPADALSLSVDGPFAADLEGQADNIMLRAARALAEATGVAGHAALTLTKRLPVAAGLGGGSADAAAVLSALCSLWQVDPGPEALDAIALELGADVPVCRYGRPARVSGIGEVIEPVHALPDAWLVLVNPRVAVPTGVIFRHCTGPYSEPAATPGTALADPAGLATWLADSHNDLEAPACQVVPLIGDSLAALAATPGCHLARMSGSGATCFGIYADGARARTAAEQIRVAQPDWWVCAAPLRR